MERIQAFAGDPTSLGKAFARADVVVHAIQFPNHPVEDPSRGRTYMEVDGKGTQVAARVAKSMGVRRFVYLSGAGAGQGRPQPWFQAKDLAEAAIRESGMEYALLRPSWMYGRGDRSMNRFVTFCRYFPVVPVIGDGRTPVYPIYVKDVARCAVDVVRREDAKDKALELGGRSDSRWTRSSGRFRRCWASGGRAASSGGTHETSGAADGTAAGAHPFTHGDRFHRAGGRDHPKPAMEYFGSLPSPRGRPPRYLPLPRSRQSRQCVSSYRCEILTSTPSLVR